MLKWQNPGRNQREIWRGFWVTLRKMWYLLTLLGIAGNVWFLKQHWLAGKLSWSIFFFVFSHSNYLCWMLLSYVRAGLAYLMLRLEFLWMTTLWNLFRGMTTNGVTGKTTLHLAVIISPCCILGWGISS